MPAARALSTHRTVAGAIPARYASTRLPGKPLVTLLGKPMIQHVWERASQVATLARVVVLTDDERIARAVEGFGGTWEMTPGDCPSGTDRIAGAAARWREDAVVNIQGDEPVVDPSAIAQLAEHLIAHPDDPVVTLATPAADEELARPEVVKVVLDRAGYALYFSRASIPYRRFADGARPLRHLGLYGYQRSALLTLAGLPPTPLERSEGLEQLRPLEHRMAMRVLLVDGASPGVDTPEDVARVEAALRSEGKA